MWFRYGKFWYNLNSVQRVEENSDLELIMSDGTELMIINKELARNILGYIKGENLER